MGSRCKRCVMDSIHGYSHKECYSCYLKNAKINVCVVCFKDIDNSSQLCRDCVYTPTIEITRQKKLNK
jgi:predicted amidophosphoribosyltransferase